MSGDGFKFRWQRAFMDSTLPPGSRHVLHALGVFMAEDGTRCFPSIDTLSNVTGLCEKAVRSNLQRAERDGWIRRWERRADNRPLAGKAAQGWRHYQYAPNIPERTAAPETAETNVRYPLPHLTPERAVNSSANVRYPLPLINQVINQEKTNRERGANAPVAAGAAPPPPVFLQDQEQNQNPETDERQQEQTASTTEPTTATQPATAAEPTAATQRAKPRQRRKEKRGTLLTFDELPDDWRQWAEDFIDHHAIGNLLDTHQKWLKFRDHYKETEDVKHDWLAIWKSWWRSDLENLKQKPSTRKMLEENRAAMARREAEQRRWEEQREAEQRKEREAAERKERDERRRIELAPVAERVKAYLQDFPHGLTGYDLANSLDMTEDALEAVYRSHLCRDPEIVCCSPKLKPTGEWISAAAHKAREAAKKAKPEAQPAPAAATPNSFNWYDDEPAAPAEPPKAAPAPASAPAPAPATRCTPAELENAYNAIMDAGPRGISFADLAIQTTPRVLKVLRDAGRIRQTGATIVATRFDGHTQPADEQPLTVLHRFCTATSTTSTVGITGRQVI